MATIPFPVERRANARHLEALAAGLQRLSAELTDTLEGLPLDARLRRVVAPPRVVRHEHGRHERADDDARDGRCEHVLRRLLHGLLFDEPDRRALADERRDLERVPVGQAHAAV